MKQDSLFFTVIKICSYLAIVFFLLMLYWSNLLIENSLNEIKQGIKNIKVTPYQRSTVVEKKTQRSHIDPKLPNLLHEDPFYETALPKLLPPNFFPHGSLIGATHGKPDNLHPFTNWGHISNWLSLCNVTVGRSQFGIWETYAPNMAIKLEERKGKDDLVEYWVHLRDQVFWQPLDQSWFKDTLAPWFFQTHQVTSEDFKFAFDAIMNPFVQQPGAIAMRNYLSEIQEIEVIDPLTFVVRWKGHDVDGEKKIIYSAKQLTTSLSPLASYVYKYFSNGKKIVEDQDPQTYLSNSVWAQNFSEHWARHVIVGCGAWFFDGISDEKIQFVRNKNHFFPLDALLTKQVVFFRNSPDVIWQDFKTNLLTTYTLQPNQIIEYENFKKTSLYAQQKFKIKELPYVSRSFFYIGWNMKTPYFSATKVRQAMTMAIDRQRIIRQNLNGLGIEITGPFYHASPSYDKSIQAWPYDPDRARQLLVEEGWQDTDGDGVIDKLIDGKQTPFRFALTYYVKDPTFKAIADSVVSFLKQVGIDCQLKGLDEADLSLTLDSKSFEALFLGWALGSPPENPKQLWYSTEAKEKGSSNLVSFANKEADEIIEKLLFEQNPEKRLSLYHRFHEIIHQEQPYTFLYVPKVTLLYRDFLQNVFLPVDRQDLIPGANMTEPSSAIFWIKNYFLD
jgi:peptide/nickel transport system substrate-binding protein